MKDGMQKVYLFYFTTYS